MIRVCRDDVDTKTGTRSHGVIVIVMVVKGLSNRY